MPTTPDPALELLALFRRAQARVSWLLSRQIADGRDVAAQISARRLTLIRETLASLEQRQNVAIALALTRTYQASVLAVDSTAGVTGAFGQVHTDSLDVLGQVLAGRLTAAVRTVGRRADDVWRRLTLERTAVSQIAGDPTNVTTRLLVSDFQKEGLTAFEDRSGRRWSLAAYADMAVRTSLRETVTVATVNRLMEGGSDLITISDHQTETELCKRYEGNTYSITGRTRGYPRLPAFPPFHPNCWHVVHPAVATFDEFERALGLDQPSVQDTGEPFDDVPQEADLLTTPTDVYPGGFARGRYITSSDPEGRDRDYMTNLVLDSKTTRSRDPEIAEQLRQAAVAAGIPAPDMVISPPADPGKPDRFTEIRRMLARDLGGADHGSPLREVADIPGYRQMTIAQRRAATRALGTGRFEVTDPDRVRGKTILIVDDVITSGEQARATRDALIAAGADDVVFLALARANGAPEDLVAE